MDRAYASGTAGSAPAAPASPSIGYPTAGNPGTGTPATKPGPYWYHQITEELLAIITAAGITPAQGTLTQLASAIQSGKLFSSAAGGTADALTASFSPAIGVLINGISLYVRAGAANATTTPTFTPNSGTIAAKTIVKGAGAALAAGDIAGGGHWIELQYDLTLDKWVLLNPASGVNATQGNFQGLNSSNVSASLAASDIGKLYLFYGSTVGQTITLPALASTPVGKNAIIVNQSSVAVTVKGNASEAISRNVIGTGQTTGNTMTLNSGDSIVFSSNGASQWNAVGLASSDQFPNSLSISGYQKLPNGLILQWVSAVVNASSSSRLTFPIAFNTVYTAVASHQQLSGSGGIALQGDLNTTGVTATNQFAGSVTVNVYALGK